MGGGIRLDLAQYRELAAFAQFASDLDEATRKQIERGQRVTEMMKQNQYATMNVAEMAVSLYAANEGFLDDLEINKVRDFEAAMQDYMKSQQSKLMDSINKKGDYNDEIQKGLQSALEDFVKNHSW